jgi:hypothetical protein
MRNDSIEEHFVLSVEQNGSYLRSNCGPPEVTTRRTILAKLMVAQLIKNLSVTEPEVSLPYSR